MKPLSRAIWFVAFIVFLAVLSAAGCSGRKKDTATSSEDAMSTKDQISPSPGRKLIAHQADSKTISVNWDAATDDVTLKKDLQYKLVYSGQNNIGTVKDAEKNGTVAMGWSPGTTSRQIKGLSSSKTYYFTALVRDEAGNMAVYLPQTLSMPDTNPPVAKGQVTFSNISKDGVVVSWPPAVDDVTTQDNLEYKLMYASPNNMRMLVNAENNSTLVMDWSLNARSKQVSGLNSINTYYFVVMVRDEAGNKAMFPPQKVSGPGASADTNVPQIDGGLAVSDVTSGTAIVTWSASSDDVSPSEKLQYKVIYSTNRDIDTVKDAEANGQTAVGWTANITSHKVSGLEPATTYYFVTLVRDEAGNTSISYPQEATTQASSGIPGEGETPEIEDEKMR